MAFDAYQGLVFAAIAAVVGIIAVSFQLRNHFIGLMVLVATAVACPIQFGGGGAGGRSPLSSSVVLAVLICAIWLADLVVFRRVSSPEPSRVRLSAWVLMGSAVGSFGLAQITAGQVLQAPQGAQLAQLAIIVVSVTLFLVTGGVIQSLKNLKSLTWLFLGCAAVVCLTTMISTDSVVGRALVGVTHGESIGSVYWSWLAAISISQALFNRELPPWLRLACAGVTVMALFRGLVLAQSWTSGWLPPLIAVFVVFLIRLPRLTILASLLVVVAILYRKPTTDTFTPEDEQYSAMTRLAAAQTLWPVIKSHPLVGLGPANYYYYVMATPILGWYVRFNSHNQYLDLAAQLGAVGVTAFLWLMFEMALALWRLRSRFHRDFCEAYVIGALAGLGATVVSGALADWILPFYYNIGLVGMRSSLLFWIFVGGGIFVLRSIQPAEAQPEIEPSQIPDLVGASPARSAIF
jgi:hypothetical protein